MLCKYNGPIIKQDLIPYHEWSIKLYFHKYSMLLLLQWNIKSTTLLTWIRDTRFKTYFIKMVKLNKYCGLLWISDAIAFFLRWDKASSNCLQKCKGCSVRWPIEFSSRSVYRLCFIGILSKPVFFLMWATNRLH